MSKELEALEKIKDYSYVDDWDNLHLLKEEHKKDLDIIENALKDYERRLTLAKEYKDVNNVAKRLKALEIIKNKKVAYLLIWLMERHTKKLALRLYNDPCDEDRKLTQEEYDLLKEVLL